MFGDPTNHGTMSRTELLAVLQHERWDTMPTPAPKMAPVHDPAPHRPHPDLGKSPSRIHAEARTQLARLRLSGAATPPTEQERHRQVADRDRDAIDKRTPAPRWSPTDLAAWLQEARAGAA